MKVVPFLGDALVLEPTVHTDARGFFLEAFNQRRVEETLGQRVVFMQDNHAGSSQNVLRGLHYQRRKPQAKLVRVLVGEVFDVGVDLRRGSPTFGQWASVWLSAENRKQLWLPGGFAHGYLAVTPRVEILVKTDDYWAPGDEHSILWNDPTLAIPWPLQNGAPILSDKDRRGVLWTEADLFP